MGPRRGAVAAVAGGVFAGLDSLGNDGRGNVVPARVARQDGHLSKGALPVAAKKKVRAAAVQRAGRARRHLQDPVRELLRWQGMARPSRETQARSGFDAVPPEVARRGQRPRGSGRMWCQTRP